MLRIGELTGQRVLLYKKSTTAKDGTVTDQYTKLGKVHNAVFSPGGKRVVGLMVKRPDIAGMVKREDAFLAWDSFKRMDEKTLLVTRADDGLDMRARKRLQLDWDACIMWAGMDARTTDGKALGYVSDAEVDEKTGAVTRFLTTDGSMARALIGSFQITPDMVRGYANGCMVIDTGGRAVELDGGLAAAAGEGYARAKVKGAEVGKKVGAAAGKAVEKGSFALGRALGKAKRAIEEASAEEEKPQVQAPSLAAEVVRVEKPAEQLPERATDASDAPARPAPKTYAPAAKKPAASAKKPTPAAKKKPAAKKPATTGDKVARAAGKQLGALGKMFGSFKDEFDKASK